MKKIYKRVAKNSGVTVCEVETKMQEAIDRAYINPSSQAKEVPREKSVPTVDEIIDYVVKQIKEE